VNHDRTHQYPTPGTTQHSSARNPVPAKRHFPSATGAHMNTAIARMQDTHIHHTADCQLYRLR